MAGMLLCGLLGILYTLGFIVASAGEHGAISHILHLAHISGGLRCPIYRRNRSRRQAWQSLSGLAETRLYSATDWRGFAFFLLAVRSLQSLTGGNGL